MSLSSQLVAHPPAPSSPVGLHRVLEPAGALPQAAYRLDSRSELWPDETRLRVAEYVCAFQEAYIRGDARGLRPLTRSEVANALGVHESTCSRAVAGKFIMLPSRKVMRMWPVKLSG